MQSNKVNIACCILVFFNHDDHYFCQLGSGIDACKTKKVRERFGIKY